MTVHLDCRPLTREYCFNNDLNSVIKADLVTKFLFYLNYCLDLFEMNLGLYLSCRILGAWYLFPRSMNISRAILSITFILFLLLICDCSSQSSIYLMCHIGQYQIMYSLRNQSCPLLHVQVQNEGVTGTR